MQKSMVCNPTCMSGWLRIIGRLTYTHSRHGMQVENSESGDTWWPSGPSAVGSILVTASAARSPLDLPIPCTHFTADDWNSTSFVISVTAPLLIISWCMMLQLRLLLMLEPTVIINVCWKFQLCTVWHCRMWRSVRQFHASLIVASKLLAYKYWKAAAWCSMNGSSSDEEGNHC